MVADANVDKVLDKIKEITGIEKIGNTKMLIEGDDILPDDITLKNVVTLIACIIKDVAKLYPQIFLEKPVVA